MKRGLLVLRRKFLAGLVVVVPIVATILAIRFLFRAIDGFLGPWMGDVIGRDIPGVGLVTTVLLVLGAGFVATNLVGRRILGLAERVFTEVPLIRRVYGASKDIVESATLSQARVFKDVVMVEYPRKGVHSYGFVTSYTTRVEHDKRNTEIANVFVPGPPVPTTGVLVAIPVDELFYLDMSVEEALKLILSLGMTAPESLVGRMPAARLDDAPDRRTGIDE